MKQREIADGLDALLVQLIGGPCFSPARAQACRDLIAPLREHSRNPLTRAMIDRLSAQCLLYFSSPHGIAVTPPRDLREMVMYQFDQIRDRLMREVAGPPGARSGQGFPGYCPSSLSS